MRYALIAAEGELTHHDGDIDWRAVIGPEGKDRVRLHPSLAVTGWVNDCGLLRPETYPRNIVGSCVLAVLGAAVQPYAGPVVLTGWAAENTALGMSEICTLRPSIDDALTTIHADVRRALAGAAVENPAWAKAMREVAEHVRTAPTPTITVLGGESL